MEALPAIPATEAGRRPALEAAEAQLKAADPLFDTSLFEAELSRRFLWVRQALASRSPEVLAGQVSAALLETWKQNAARQVAAGVHTEQTGLRVDEIRPIWLVVGPVRDRFTVAIDHTVAVTGVSDDDGRVVFGGEEGPAIEYWTLSRPTGAQTVAEDAGPGECPSCGAPADRGRGPACPYCRAELPSALLGWMLDRADDEVPWRPVPVEVTPEDERRRRELAAEDDWLDSQLRNQNRY